VFSEPGVVVELGVVLVEVGASEVVTAVGVDAVIDPIDAVLHPPTMDGTAFRPCEIATSSVPQLAACARCRLRLS